MDKALVEKMQYAIEVIKIIEGSITKRDEELKAAAEAKAKSGDAGLFDLIVLNSKREAYTEISIDLVEYKAALAKLMVDELEKEKEAV